ncbi:MAG: ComF family protein [Bryobacteraceae bacterium]
MCDQPLRTVSRIPVCPSCLALPEPLEAEFFCLGCRTPFSSAFALGDDGFCSICRDGLVGFDAAYSFGSYEGALRKLIHLFKYGKVESLAGPLSRFLLTAVPLDVEVDAVIAMPMHWRKQWERGFNQAELLAAPLARRYGLKLGTNLRRQRYTVAQASLTEAQRLKNLDKSFRVKRPEDVSGKRILLIDDVFTTGTTLRTAAEALKAAGAAHVSALTLARVDRRLEGQARHGSAEARKRDLSDDESFRAESDFAPSFAGTS